MARSSSPTISPPLQLSRPSDSNVACADVAPNEEVDPHLEPESDWEAVAVQLQKEVADEKRRRESAERQVANLRHHLKLVARNGEENSPNDPQLQISDHEVTELRKRLALANEEARIWRQKCELLEVELQQHSTPASFDPGPAVGTDKNRISAEEALLEAHATAIESALDKIYSQRAMLTKEMEVLRQRMRAALEAEEDADECFN